MRNFLISCRFYRPYFNINTEEVLYRLGHSFFPYIGTFYMRVKDKPDLWATNYYHLVDTVLYGYTRQLFTCSVSYQTLRDISLILENILALTSLCFPFHFSSYSACLTCIGIWNSVGISHWIWHIDEMPIFLDINTRGNVNLRVLMFNIYSNCYSLHYSSQCTVFTLIY